MSNQSKSVVRGLKTSFALLSQRERFKFGVTSIAQIGLSFLDLIGVMLIGAIAALAINGISSKGPGDRVKVVLDFIGINNFNLQKQTLILGSLSAILLITKTILNFFVTKRTSYFLSRRAAIISNDLFRKLLKKDLIYIRSRSTQQLLFSLTTSVQSLVNGLLITFSTMISDLVLTTTLIIGLALLDWKMSIFTIMFYGVLAITLNKKIKHKYASLGERQSNFIVKSNTLFVDAINSYRDMVVRSARGKVSKEFSDQRLKLAEFSAEFALSNNISKYVLEVALVAGSIVVCGYEFATQDASRAIATLAVFLASSARIAPAIMRLQQGALTMKSTIASAQVLDNMITELNVNGSDIDSENFITSKHVQPFVSRIEVIDLNFRYPNNDSFAIENLNLEVKQGEFCAFVGPSGGGKSTLVDLILGVVTPTSGEIQISGITPELVYKVFEGKVGYVPQEVHILDGTIRENVSFYENPNNAQVESAIRSAQLHKLVEELPEGVDTYIGERGTRLSGGQRQRLGIARALYTDPELIILDEATSALDGNTEAEISKTLHSLKGSKTLVVIAHRLSTVKDADKVVYIDGGKIIAQGTFDEVRSAVPDFDKQAKLLRL